MSPNSETMTNSQISEQSSYYRYFVLFMLIIAYTFNVIDRQIIGILSPAIKDEMGLSDSALGLLKGLAFALIYSLMSIPVAWLSDQKNRKNIISIALFVWSASTALASVATSFTHLIISRIGVGLGESGCTPPSHSIISDYFPKNQLARALSVYALAVPIGSVIAYIGGGIILDHFDWRYAFLILGVPGVVFALLFNLLVKEPSRGTSQKSLKMIKEPSTNHYFKDLFKILSSPSYWGMTIGFTLIMVVMYGIGAWTLDYYHRAFDMTYTEISVPIGLIQLVAVGIGIIMGGILTDKIANKNKSIYALMPAFGAFISIPSIYFAFQLDDFFMAMVWYTPMQVGQGLMFGAGFAVIQLLAPPSHRAMSIAVFLMVMNIGGMGLGPVWIGVISDMLLSSHGEVVGLRIAIFSTMGILILAVFILIWTARRMPDDLARVEE
ncbi:MAG: MFS transporter [Paraglaciecola sp.]|nr:MFS transporter [Paraglaciecola sp.]